MTNGANHNKVQPSLRAGYLGLDAAIDVIYGAANKHILGDAGHLIVSTMKRLTEIRTEFFDREFKKWEP